MFSNLFNLTVQFFLEKFSFYRILIENFFYIFIPNNRILDFENSILYATSNTGSNDSNDFNDSDSTPNSNNSGDGNKRKREDDTNDNYPNMDPDLASENEDGEPASKKAKIEDSSTDSGQSTSETPEDLDQDQEEASMDEDFGNLTIRINELLDQEENIKAQIESLNSNSNNYNESLNELNEQLENIQEDLYEAVNRRRDIYQEDMDDVSPQDDDDQIEDSVESYTNHPQNSELVDSKDSSDSKDTGDNDSSTFKETADSLNQPLKYLEENNLDNNNLIYNSNEWFNKFLNNLLE